MSIEPVRVPTTYTCGGCDNRWSGISRAHATCCHRTFASAEMFDKHRRYGCTDPATIFVTSRKDGSKRPLMKFDGSIWRDAREWDAAEIFPKDAA